jgi:hypothetical protein
MKYSLTIVYLILSLNISAQIEVKNKTIEKFFKSIEEGNVEKVDKMCRKYPGIERLKNKDGIYPLEFAIILNNSFISKHEHNEICRKIIHFDKNDNYYPCSKNKPLIYALIEDQDYFYGSDSRSPGNNDIFSLVQRKESTLFQKYSTSNNLIDFLLKRERYSLCRRLMYSAKNDEFIFDQMIHNNDYGFFIYLYLEDFDTKVRSRSANPGKIFLEHLNETQIESVFYLTIKNYIENNFKLEYEPGIISQYEYRKENPNNKWFKSSDHSFVRSNNILEILQNEFTSFNPNNFKNKLYEYHLTFGNVNSIYKKEVLAFIIKTYGVPDNMLDKSYLIETFADIYNSIQDIPAAKLAVENIIKKNSGLKKYEYVIDSMILSKGIQKTFYDDFSVNSTEQYFSPKYIYNYFNQDGNHAVRDNTLIVRSNVVDNEPNSKIWTKNGWYDILIPIDINWTEDFIVEFEISPFFQPMKTYPSMFFISIGAKHISPKCYIPDYNEYKMNSEPYYFFGVSQRKLLSYNFHKKVGKGIDSDIYPYYKKQSKYYRGAGRTSLQIKDKLINLITIIKEGEKFQFYCNGQLISQLDIDAIPKGETYLKLGTVNAEVNIQKITYYQQASDCVVLMPELGISFDGKCKNGKANGFGHAKGEWTYDGGFLNGYPHGNGTLIENQSKFRKAFLGSVSKESNNEYKGEFDRGLKHGKGVYDFWATGNTKFRYEGEFVNNVFHGKGKLTLVYYYGLEKLKGYGQTSAVSSEGTFINGYSKEVYNYIYKRIDEHNLLENNEHLRYLDERNGEGFSYDVSDWKETEWSWKEKKIKYDGFKCYNNVTYLYLTEDSKVCLDIGKLNNPKNCFDFFDKAIGVLKEQLEYDCK